jgi:bifunctional enzyme CysN/CysC/sulfate adenylyltransferase subunit 1
MIAAENNHRHPSFAAFLEQDLSKSLLRFTTAGSVDDGKSTLIGRLLHDSKSVYEDQLASVKKSKVNRSSGPIDFSLLTDGLRAEREQGITIDVAYRYFATARRKFIIADTPGHEQYTRNMATGASTADLAVILIDGTKGLLPQTRRHAFIASLLGISNVLAAVNKMDLMDFREDVFLRLEKDFLALARQLGIPNVQCTPISALEGDNVVERSQHTPWHDGPTLLEHLETVPLPEYHSRVGLRFPVQSVIRPDARFRGFAGRIAGGSVRPGDAVLALPSGQKSRVRSIVTFDGELPQATAPMSVTLQLEDEIDLSRGDMLVAPHSPPSISREFHATVVWLHTRPLEVGRTYLIKHATRQTKIKAVRIRHGVNINSYAKEPAVRLDMNDIGVVEFQAHAPLFFDTYSQNRTSGSFILIDPFTNATVGAGMIAEDPVKREFDVQPIFPTQSIQAVTSQERYHRNGHYPAVLILNGLPLVRAVERILFDQGCHVLDLSSTEVRPSEFAGIAETAKMAGLILLLSGKALDAETKRQIESAVLGRFFDLTTTDSVRDRDTDSAENEYDEQETVQRVLAIVDSLRIMDPPGNHSKVN